MIDIQTALDNILKARYGRDVRQSIHDAIAQENDNLEESREFVEQKAQEATQAAEEVEQATATATQAATDAEGFKAAAESAAQSAATDAATIAENVEAAAQSATEAAGSAQSAKESADSIQGAAEQTAEYMAEAESAKTEAAASAEAAQQAQADAAASKEAAATSAQSAEAQSTDAKQSARDAETARAGAELAQAEAQTAATDAAEKAVADVQQQLSDEVAAAQEAAESAKDYSGKPPIIQDSNWWTWDAESGDYTNTGQRAVLGIDKTYTSVQEMEEDLSQPENTVAIIQSGAGSEDNGKIYIFNGESWQYMADLSGFEGIGIQSIELTDGNHAAGTTDTYTITLTDASEYTFTVYNGRNGEGVGDMLAQTYDPDNHATDIFKYADEAAKAAAENATVKTDAQPTEGSQNAVQSGGTYAAIAAAVVEAKNYTDDETAAVTEALNEYKTTNDQAVQDAAQAASDAQTAADSAQASADAAQDAADTAQSAADEKVAKAGDTMTGALDMGGNKITSLAEPTETTDAATKNFVDKSVEARALEAGRAGVEFTISEADWQTQDEIFTINIDTILTSKLPDIFSETEEDGKVAPGKTIGTIMPATTADFKTMANYNIGLCGWSGGYGLAADEKPAEDIKLRFEYINATNLF